MKFIGLFLWCLFIGNSVGQKIDCSTEEKCTETTKSFLEEYEKEMMKKLRTAVQASWNYNTNINEDTQAESISKSEELAAYSKEQWEENVKQIDLNKLDETTPEHRRAKKMKVVGTAALPKDRYSLYANTIASMTSIYSSAKICPFKNQNCNFEEEGLLLEDGIEPIINNPQDHSYEELAYTWEAWREVSGKPIKDFYKTYLELNSEAAQANGLTSATEMWLTSYTDDMLEEDGEFRQNMEEAWNEVKPLYEKLHAYIRYKYNEYWKAEENIAISMTEPIPAHITGNMWSQGWGNSFDIVSPYPDVESPLSSVTDNMEKLNYDEKRMFEDSNQFFLDMELEDNSMSYSPTCDFNEADAKQCQEDRPMIQQPPVEKNWTVVCHASAWDMYKDDRSDYRIKQCTQVNFNSYIVVHHEMGHIQYFIQYDQLPLQFRDGANPGFHEAIGDVMSLAVQTPEHLKGLNLLDKDFEVTEEADINYLMNSAMDKVMFLPFGYLIDQFRWALFDGEINEANMNREWWRLRETYQGIQPPGERTEEQFDAGSKYHVPADVPYIRYFVSHLLQFQMYKELCIASGKYDPKGDSKLHTCDFSTGRKSGKAGKILDDMMSLGSSQLWPDVLEQFTESRNISSGPLLEYYAPLHKFLDEYIEEHNINVGWTSTLDEYFPSPENEGDDNNGATSFHLSIISFSMIYIIHHLLN